MKKNILKVILLLGIFCLLFTNNTYASGGGTGGGGGGGGGGDRLAEATGSGGDMMIVLCNVLVFVTGGVGKTIASFIIIGVGIGFFTGKVSWGLLIGVTLGISAMFGAPAIIGAITGDSNFIDKCTQYD